MKGGLVGYGFIGARGHIPGYATRPGLTIEAIADICPARREAAARELPGVRIYEDHEALLAAEAGRLDFIDICTPPRDHLPIALAALERGLHVVCEKPLTMNPAEAERLLDAAAQARRTVMPCHNYKHAPVVKTMRRLIEEGTLGCIRAATISTYRTTHARGVEAWDTHWRRRPAIGGGGIAMDHGPHSFYVTFLFMGGFPQSIAATTHRGDPEWPTESTVSATLGFPAGLVNVYLTWEAGVRKVIYTIHGDRGAAVIDDDDLLLNTAAGRERRRLVSDFDDASHHTWFGSLFAQFEEAVARGEHVGPELVEAAVCMDLIDGVYRSDAAEGRRLAVDPARFIRRRSRGDG